MAWQEKRQKLETLLAKHHQLLVPISVIGGFILHLIMFQQIDEVFENVVLIIHLIISAACIALLFSKNTRLGERLRIVRIQNIIHTIMLISFGALFGAFVIFYAKSGSFLASAPFIILMFALMIGAEVFKKYYQELLFQIAFYFIALFSHLIFFIPLLTNKIGAGIFLLSGGVSLILIALYLRLLWYLDNVHFQLYKKKIVIAIVSVFALFNLFYFTNIIPPVPLSLKFGAVYHSIVKKDVDTYEGVYEPARLLSKRSRRYHWTPGEPVYVFTSVYAPAKVETNIYHQWEHYDEVQDKWIDSTRISIAISGGREEGFRGFSMKNTLNPGLWRVRVTNKRGQTLGFVRFRILPIEKEITIEKEIL